MTVLYFDCTNGVSGDMILKALLELGDCRQQVESAMAAADFEKDVHDHRHSHDHLHGHGRSYHTVRRLIQDSGVTPNAQACALRIYEHLAQAEAKVHGESLETIHFHEVGRDEAIKNALGIGMALEIIAPDEVYTSDIYDGTGTIVCSHGEIPVPVPAVQALREKCSYVFKQANIQTELVTPSGLASLMGIGAKPGYLKGSIVRKTEVRGSRDTGRDGFKAYLVEERDEAGPVRNPSLKDAIQATKQDASMEHSVRLLNEVVRAKLLAPVEMDKPPEYDETLDEVVLEKDTEIRFELIKADNGDLYYPVFTDGEEMKKCEIEQDQHSLMVNFEDLAALLLQPQNEMSGFVINPMSDNLVFSTQMVAAMKKDMAKGPAAASDKEGGN